MGRAAGMTPAAAPFHRMAQNNAWANETLYAALAHVGQQAFVAARPGYFGSLSRTMNHIFEVDLYYLDAIEAGGLGRSVYDRKDIVEPTQLGALQSDADARLTRVCAELNTDRLSEVRQTIRADTAAVERVDALLLHLFQHQIHHRGQAHVQLQHAGLSPPQLDEFHLEFERAPTAKAYFR